MPDPISLPAVLTTTAPATDQINVVQTLQNISSFYNHSFVVLTTIVVIFLAIAGILVPLFNWLLQRRAAKDEERRLEVKIRELTTDAKKELTGYFESRTAELRQALEEAIQAKINEVKREINFAIIGVFRVQAQVHKKEFPILSISMTFPTNGGRDLSRVRLIRQRSVYAKEALYPGVQGRGVQAGDGAWPGGRAQRA